MQLVGNVGINRVRANCSDFIIGLEQIVRTLKTFGPFLKWCIKNTPLKLYSTVIFTKEQEKRKKGWRGRVLRENGIGLQNSAYGISGRLETGECDNIYNTF